MFYNNQNDCFILFYSAIYDAVVFSSLINVFVIICKTDTYV